MSSLLLYGFILACILMLIIVALLVFGKDKESLQNNSKLPTKQQPTGKSASEIIHGGKKKKDSLNIREISKDNKKTAIIETNKLKELPPSKYKRKNQSTILLVEDSLTARITIKKILNKWHYNVIEAEDGKKAWEFLQKNKPDLIISDIDMPQLTGLELLKLIREDMTLVDIPVILITGSPKYHLQAAQQTGVDGLLSKPFEDKDLIDQVRFLLQE